MFKMTHNEYVSKCLRIKEKKKNSQRNLTPQLELLSRCADASLIFDLMGLIRIFLFHRLQIKQKNAVKK